MAVFKLTCLLPFGKNLSFLLLSELVGGAGLGSTALRMAIAAPLASPHLPLG